jgi:hypothetical protein
VRPAIVRYCRPFAGDEILPGHARPVCDLDPFVDDLGQIGCAIGVERARAAAPSGQGGGLPSVSSPRTGPIRCRALPALVGRTMHLDRFRRHLQGLRAGRTVTRLVGRVGTTRTSPSSRRSCW